jgi:phosphatidylglycerol:prolipoprotein diacylglycerol transferase
MQQILFRIPFPFFGLESIPVFGFGVMLCLAFLVCTWLAARRGRRVGIPPAYIQDLVIWLFVGGILGARVSYLLLEAEPRPDLWEFFRQLPQIWNGGIIFYGSVIGGLVGYLGAWFFLFRRHQIPTLRLADVIAPSIAVGLCLGRIGCFLNGCCYGQVACADCAVYPVVHFPVSAPPRESLVDAGLQTAEGFTFAADQPAADQPAAGARVGRVEPDSAAWRDGLRPGDVIVRVDGKSVAELYDEMQGRDPARWAGGKGAHPDVEVLSAYLGSLHYWPLGKKSLELAVERPGESAPVELPPFRPHTLGLYPTQLYESTSMVLLLLVLLAYEPFRRHEGQVMALLMMGYAVHRYLNEMLRDDTRPVGFEWQTSVILFAAGLALWLWLQRRPAGTAQAPPAPAPAGA